MGFTKHDWREAITLLARYNEEVDVKKARLLIRDTYPDYIIDDITEEDISMVIKAAREPINDEEFYKNTKTINAHTAQLYLRHQDVNHLYKAFEATLERLRYLELKHHFIQKIGHYYQLTAIFETDKPQHYFTGTVSSASVGAITKIKRRINRKELEERHVAFLTYYQRKTSQVPFNILVKELKERYPNTVITSSFMEGDGRIQFSAAVSKSKSLKALVNEWKDFIVKHRSVTGERLICDFSNYK